MPMLIDLIAGGALLAKKRLQLERDHTEVVIIDFGDKELADGEYGALVWNHLGFWHVVQSAGVKSSMIDLSSVWAVLQTVAYYGKKREGEGYRVAEHDIVSRIMAAI